MDFVVAHLSGQFLHEGDAVRDNVRAPEVLYDLACAPRSHVLLPDGLRDMEASTLRADPCVGMRIFPAVPLAVRAEGAPAPSPGAPQGGASVKVAKHLTTPRASKVEDRLLDVPRVAVNGGLRVRAAQRGPKLLGVPRSMLCFGVVRDATKKCSLCVLRRLANGTKGKGAAALTPMDAHDPAMVICESIRVLSVHRSGDVVAQAFSAKRVACTVPALAGHRVLTRKTIATYFAVCLDEPSRGTISPRLCLLNVGLQDLIKHGKIFQGKSPLLLPGRFFLGEPVLKDFNNFAGVVRLHCRTSSLMPHFNLGSKCAIEEPIPICHFFTSKRAGSHPTRSYLLLQPSSDVHLIVRVPVPGDHRTSHHLARDRAAETVWRLCVLTYFFLSLPDLLGLGLAPGTPCDSLLPGKLRLGLVPGTLCDSLLPGTLCDSLLPGNLRDSRDSLLPGTLCLGHLPGRIYDSLLLGTLCLGLLPGTLCDSLLPPGSLRFDQQIHLRR